MENRTQNLISRPPVVVVMGHVDHGKTSILDYIRKTHIADKESGGITQHIGASQVVFNGKPITFIDTPGHEAFSQMRLRGAKIADIAVLVVAAEEGLKPQTKEAIAAIRKAGIPMVIAMNKIDLPTANPEKVKRELQKEDIVIEEWGGQTPSLNVSAKTGKGIDELLEMILLVAEVENFQADAGAAAQGIIIESRLDRRRGPSASILLQSGTLTTGKIVATSTTFGKVKTLENSRGEKIDSLFPSQPAIVIGFEAVPIIGDVFQEVSGAEEAQSFAANHKTANHDKASPRKTPVLTENQKKLDIIIKADVLGSLEVLEETVKQIPQNEVILNIIDAGVGEINLNDVKMAHGDNAIIVGFRVKVNSDAKTMAERDKIRIMNFDIIYEMIEWMRGYMEKVKTPQVVRKDSGKLKVLLSFWGEKNRQIVGGKIIEGSVKRGLKIEVVRNDRVIAAGRLVNLQKNKKDIDQAAKGDEVGILYEGPETIKEGDYLVFFAQEKNF